MLVGLGWGVGWRWGVELEEGLMKSKCLPLRVYVLMRVCVCGLCHQKCLVLCAPFHLYLM